MSGVFSLTLRKQLGLIASQLNSETIWRRLESSSTWNRHETLALARIQTLPYHSRYSQIEFKPTWNISISVISCVRNSFYTPTGFYLVVTNSELKSFDSSTHIEIKSAR